MRGHADSYEVELENGKDLTLPSDESFDHFPFDPSDVSGMNGSSRTSPHRKTCTALTKMLPSPVHILGLVGYSGSGKTTLTEKLVPALIKAGLSVSTIKHIASEFDVDTPVKDSWRHRQAGAHEVLVASAQRVGADA